MSRTLNKSQVPFANQFLVSGTATFTNSTNNVSLTGIGSRGIEIGDVVEFSGTVSNDGLYTAEVLTDANNIVFNQAHAGGSTSKAFTDETVATTVTLVAKWFNAPIGLGQGYCSPTRSSNVTYTNNTGRAIKVLWGLEVTSSTATFTIDGVLRAKIGTGGSTGRMISWSASLIVEAGSSWETSRIVSISELR
jgi:hypothetical protein